MERAEMKKRPSIYLLQGGNGKVGFFFLSMFFNYRKNAVRYRDHFHPDLKVVKFESVK
jgi:hypothetical protein